MQNFYTLLIYSLLNHLTQVRHESSPRILYAMHGAANFAVYLPPLRVCMCESACECVCVSAVNLNIHMLKMIKSQKFFN